MPKRTDADEAGRRQRQIQRALDEGGSRIEAPGEETLVPDPHQDRTRTFRSTSFSRMRTAWAPDDKIQMLEIERLAGITIMERFIAAYDLMDRIWIVVREPLTSPSTGLPMLDITKRPRWKRNAAGAFIEDWTKLGDRERLGFLYETTTHLFEWSQAAADLWGGAMFAKAIWEEAFASGFTRPAGRLTIDDRTQMGHLASIGDRYFAIFQSLLSRKADALVRSMERLDQRLKDTYQM